jgi:SAM-dependent methyltransferase
MSAPPSIFNRSLYARRRDRAAAAFGAHDFLHRRAMADVVDRLESVTRDFPRALFYGAGGLMTMSTDKAGVGEIVEADLAPARVAGAGVVFDEEASPFAPSSFDLVVSLLTLHAANDLIGALAQMRLSLKPDGLLIAVLFGEETLRELRAALYESEATVRGGVSPRIAPFASVRDLGQALQRAGFALPVADLDRVEVRYRASGRLLSDLRGMGETNALNDAGRGLRRDVLRAALARLGAQSVTTFDLVTLTGWAPHPDQPRPLKPGSASHALKDALREF